MINVVVVLDLNINIVVMGKTKADVSVKLLNLLEDKSVDEILTLFANFTDAETYNNFYLFVKDELDLVDDYDANSKAMGIEDCYDDM